MSEFTLPELADKLRECAGESEGIDLDSDAVLDVPFIDLGYDSLALLEVAGRITRDYGVALPDEALDSAETPRAFVDLVNSTLSGS